MTNRCAERDSAANILERRWFSSIAAVRAARSECEVLREVVELAEDAWRRARAHLTELEILRDALGEELAALDQDEVAANRAPKIRVMSAA